MRLVLFTAHYPYRGEAFLEDEIRVAERFFDEILIVTLEKNPNQVVYYIPKNARAIPVRSKTKKYSGVFHAACNAVFKRHAFHEIGVVKKAGGEHSLCDSFKSIVADERSILYLERAQNQWLDNAKETVFYSYWLGSETTYMVRHRKQLNGLHISRAHGGDCFFDRGFHPYRVEQLTALDRVFPISESGKKDLLEHYVDAVPELEKKLIVARLGITKPTDQMNPENRTDVKTVVSCSNVIPLKRLDLLVDALSVIKEHRIHWVHFGDGSDMGMIQKLAAEKLRDNVTADFRGFIPKQDILKYYTDNPVDVFVNCSDAEGIPVSVMEAMAYGIPPVTRDVGGMTELVDDTCGILLHGNVNGKALADAIHRVLNMDKVSYQTLQANAYDKYRRFFSAEQNYMGFFGMITKEH